MLFLVTASQNRVSHCATAMLNIPIKNLRCGECSWLGSMDSNHGMEASKAPALPLGYSPKKVAAFNSTAFLPAKNPVFFFHPELARTCFPKLGSAYQVSIAEKDNDVKLSLLFFRFTCESFR